MKSLRLTRFFTFVFLTFNVACATTQKAHATLDGVDTFGSQRVTEADITAKYGAMIDNFVALQEKDSESAFQIKKEIEDGIKSDFDVAFAEISVISYFKPSRRYATVDLVEKQDVKERMPFLAAPRGACKDPEGALALWNEYQKSGFDLLKSGKLGFSKRCPVWHCVFGFDHPKLAPYLPRFNALAAKHETELVQILRNDAKPGERAAAAFLLAHIKDGNAVVRYLLPSLFDPEKDVRNNVLRVFALIANDHPEIRIPVAPIVTALHFPTTTDRNKAGYVLAALAKNEENKSAILAGDGWTIIDMLKLKQPNNHDPAYAVLKTLSGKSFAERDYGAWESWIESRLGPRSR